MKWLVTTSWVLFALEAAVLVAWVFFALRDVGHDPGERVWTTVFVVVPSVTLVAAGSLLYYGQRHQSDLALSVGVALVVLPLVGLLVGNAWRAFDRLDRSNSRAQAGRFADDRLTEIAAAVDRGDTQTLRGLIASHSPDWSARDRQGRTLLGHAIKRVIDDYSGASGVQAVRALVQAGARVGTNDLESKTPFMYEVLSANSPGSEELLDVVLEAGGDPNATDSLNEPLIHLLECSRPKLEVLARHGADLRALSHRDDRQGWTALMTAAHLQQWDKALYLVDQGVPPNHRAADGTTLASILDDVAARTRQADGRLDPGYDALRSRLGRLEP